ncbi:MAG: response regulator [Sulfuricurvum sp.]|uniref:response regulator n=1 Tax=Sulfuricurvum sp. TaxID=2025608 RepID=UPI002612ACB8|nr:response regulator [Sulfuricurvum sp.]MDD2828683.1 response regulator [Sulfuricurvum sp.]MDD4949261.1 response regulator [Sulfuricurvum sp.]
MKKLLIIEDNLMVAGMIREIAIGVGIEVIGIADSWSEAEKIILTIHPDFAIVDINIKGSIDGVQAATKLKHIGVESLFLTAYKDLDIIKEATDLAPLSYMIKPITPENLMATFILAINKLDLLKPANPSPTYTVATNGLIYKGQHLVSLSKSERLVLSLLLKHLGQNVDYELLFYTLGEYSDARSEASLRNITAKIRRKCPDITIQNIKGVGYSANINN